MTDKAPVPHPLGADRTLGQNCGPGLASPAGQAAAGGSPVHASHPLLAVVENLVPGTRIPQDTLAALLESVAYGSAELLEALKRKAQGVLASRRGTTVYYRGLLEFSNLCQRNCLYCGIRAGNTSVDRFTLSLDEIGETAKWCAENGYGSLTLQSGERSDAAFVDFVEQAILRIKAESRSENQPEGLGITLCVGELDEASLRRLMTAGAHRYLLRVETTNPQLYAQLHPGADGGLDQRVANLRLLKRLGFQVGTGVMIGLPGQTMADLAADLHFFYNEGVQMIGMGPYIPHQDTPLGAARFSAPGAENAGGGGGRPERQPGGTRVEPETAAAVRPRSSAAAAAEDAGAGGAGARGAPPLSGSPDSLLPDRVRFELGLAMVALARIMLPASNVAATTALQALHPFGRELGLDSGANILMPLVTPGRVRGQYQLYDGKPCVDDELDECRDCLAARVSRTRREVGYHAYGDSLIPVDRG